METLGSPLGCWWWVTCSLSRKILCEYKDGFRTWEDGGVLRSCTLQEQGEPSGAFKPGCHTWLAVQNTRHPAWDNRARPSHCRAELAKSTML